MRNAENSARPGRSTCRLEWLRENGLWSAADDAIVIARRYGADALDSHRYCCVAQPWRT
jgi:hypothetical protein